VFVKIDTSSCLSQYNQTRLSLSVQRMVGVADATFVTAALQLPNLIVTGQQYYYATKIVVLSQQGPQTLPTGFRFALERQSFKVGNMKRVCRHQSTNSNAATDGISFVQSSQSGEVESVGPHGVCYCEPYPQEEYVKHAESALGGR
jgi:hypothetical protein